MIYNPHITNATLRIANPEGQVDWGRYYHRNMFGDFLRNHERLDYSDLRYKEPGTPIVIRYSNRMFQFGIYGENRVIFQRCFSLGAVIFFSIERCSAKRFCVDGPSPTSSARDRGGFCDSFLTGRQFRSTTNYHRGVGSCHQTGLRQMGKSPYSDNT